MPQLLLYQQVSPSPLVLDRVYAFEALKTIGPDNNFTYELSSPGQIDRFKAQTGRLAAEAAREQEVLARVDPAVLAVCQKDLITAQTQFEQLLRKNGDIQGHIYQFSVNNNPNRVDLGLVRDYQLIFSTFHTANTALSHIHYHQLIFKQAAKDLADLQALVKARDTYYQSLVTKAGLVSGSVLHSPTAKAAPGAADKAKLKVQKIIMDYLAYAGTDWLTLALKGDTTTANNSTRQLIEEQWTAKGVYSPDLIRQAFYTRETAAMSAGPTSFEQFLAAFKTVENNHEKVFQQLQQDFIEYLQTR